MKQSDPSKPLVVFDYEGTLGTSKLRHYHQYVEALRRIRIRLKLEQEALLQPLSEAEFLERYGRGRDILDVFSTISNTSEGRITRALLKRQHQEIIWLYEPTFMQFEKPLPGALECLRSIASIARPAVISYTRQDPEDFADHLERMGLAGPNAIRPDRVHAVGSEGSSSRAAKTRAITLLYGDLITDQVMRGGRPIMVGDDTDDMLAAFDAGLDFVGVTETGKSSKGDFATAYDRLDAVARRALSLVDSVASPDLLQHIQLLSGRLNPINA